MFDEVVGIEIHTKNTEKNKITSTFYEIPKTYRFNGSHELDFLSGNETKV